ncbi:tRNA lysidine(34) synthetase TilS [Lacticaseibacillus daqingensis]|uniref:tRNA lysidine(34) synthetase TilS n=1 Tax=Lacticaseibacillus daqingensis TaxID=2486014 RepID=UPI000F783948|nr:tRNA lysidine(34) synthetase TilS [Lacticaseibacillus daqingensis]
MLDGAQLMAPYALTPGTGVVVAVSGGVDSMVLMTLLAPLHPHQLRLTVAQYDHQLRPTSAAEQAAVVAYAKQLGLPVQTGRWERSAQPHAGLEAAARTARYAFLTATAHACGATVIATAHHADDQLETLLFRLTRSGRARALTGIAPARPLGDLTVIHPLLAVAKAELQAFAAAHAVPVLEDASNRDLRFSRNQLRAQVVPVLKAQNPQVLAHTTRLTTELSGLIALADQQASQLLTAAAVGSDTVDWHPFLAQAHSTQQVLLQAQLRAWQCHLPQATQTALLQALQQAPGARTFAAGAVTLTVSDHRLHRVRVAAPAMTPVVLAAAEQWYAVPGGRIGRFATRPSEATEWALVPAGPLTVRTRRPGDRLVLPNGQHQLLRRFWINAKVPTWARATRLIACTEDTVVWVQGKERAQLFQVPQTDIIQAVLAFQTLTEGTTQPHE